ncbi:hypothetical protein [Synechococcus sp. CBW1006]|nr:hypothetical protein H8F26_15720 [Synechococcus sp. CBW1006]
MHVARLLERLSSLCRDPQQVVSLGDAAAF